MLGWPRPSRYRIEPPRGKRLLAMSVYPCLHMLKISWHLPPCDRHVEGCTLGSDFKRRNLWACRGTNVAAENQDAAKNLSPSKWYLAAHPCH